jgi:hypothetical protein
MAISQTPWQGNHDSLHRRFAEDIVVDTMLAYRAEWRAEAAAVADAYRRWADAAPNSERVRLYSAYAVALDREHAAAERYAQAAARVQRSLARGSSRSAP